jgi:defect-in-organelle-trafficking protein DotC
MNKVLLILLITAGLATLSGCKSMRKPVEVGPLDQLDSIEKLNQDDVDEETAADGKMRNQILRDTAQSLGARGGLAARTEQINDDLEEQTAYLTDVFNFQGLMLPNNILPPVLVEGRDALNLDGPYTIRVADRNFRIVKQAKFVTAVPTWQDYLIVPVQQPEAPAKSLLPKRDDEDELEIWQEYSRKGWEQGIIQADTIYAENLARLKRDYTGMIRYRKLLAQNMVSPPLVAEKEMGVTGGGDQISVNDRVLTIKALPSLKADSEQWTPIVVDE